MSEQRGTTGGTTLVSCGKEDTLLTGEKAFIPRTLLYNLGISVLHHMT